MTKTPKATTDKKQVPQEIRDLDVEGMAGHFLAFRIGDRKLAFPLEKVERVIRMAALVPVPDSPEWLSGLINLGGTVMPVITLRKRLGLSQIDIHPDHRILVMQTQNRRLGIIAETVEEVIAVSEDHEAKPEGTLRKSPLLNAVIRKNDEVYLVLEADEVDTGAVIEFEKVEAA